MTTPTLERTESKQSKYALHVEDDRTLQSTIGAHLKEAGYDIIQTNNLRDAERFVQNQRFDLYVVAGRFPPVRGGLKELDTSLKLYETVKQQHGLNLNFVVISTGDASVESECRKRSIRLFDRTRLEVSFVDYLNSLK